jgi:hypothetical protein
MPETDHIPEEEGKMPDESAQITSDNARKSSKQLTEELKTSSGEESVNIVRNASETKVGPKSNTPEIIGEQAAQELGMDQEKSKEIKEAMKDMHDPIYKKIKEGKTMAEAILEAAQDLQTTQKSWSDKKKEAMKEYCKKFRDGMYSSATKLGDLPRKMWTKMFGDSRYTIDPNKPLAPQVDRINKLIEKDIMNSDEFKNDREKFKKNGTDKNTKKAAKDISDGKTPERKTSWKDIIKYLAMLGALGGTIWGFWYALHLYAANHSGCMLIKRDAGQDESAPQKVFCFDENNTYNPAICSCFKKDSKIQPSTTTCLTGTSGPYPGDMKGKSRTCKNWETLDGDYLYYTYKIMGPLEALGDIANGLVNAPLNWFDKLLNIIKKYAIYIIVFIFILMAGYLVFKYIRYREEKMEKTL